MDSPADSSAGPLVTQRFLEFFTVPIGNRNTRLAYFTAVRQFCEWCQARGIALPQVEPIILAAYHEQHTGSLPTIKQHFSALRMFFAWLVEKGLLKSNPVREVKTEKFQRHEGKTPALTVEEMHQLFESFDTSSVVGLRDQALIGVLAFTFARIEAVVNMKVKDYFQNGKRSFVRLQEKGGKQKEIPVHHRLEEYLDGYIQAAGIGQDREGPLFRTAVRKTQHLTTQPIRRTDAWAMVRRRIDDAGLVGGYGCHSFRATGITTFLENGGTWKPLNISRAMRIQEPSSSMTAGPSASRARISNGSAIKALFQVKRNNI